MPAISSTFEPQEPLLSDLLKDIWVGKIQRPDFQRPWFGMICISALYWQVYPELILLVQLCYGKLKGRKSGLYLGL